jgi:phage shock protein PspC (stress-responsive transcriptional regulator)
VYWRAGGLALHFKLNITIIFGLLIILTLISFSFFVVADYCGHWWVLSACLKMYVGGNIISDLIA